VAAFQWRGLRLSSRKAKSQSLLRKSPSRSTGFLLPSPPAEQATARQDQAGKASASDRAGDGGDGRRIKANNQLVPKIGCPRQTDPRSKGLAEAILPIAI